MRYELALQNGWLSYEVKVLPDNPVELVCTYLGEVTTLRNFDILVNDQKVATETLSTLNQPAQLFNRVYPVPQAMPRGLDHVTLKLQPCPPNSTGRLVAIHILRAEN